MVHHHRRAFTGAGHRREHGHLQIFAQRPQYDFIGDFAFGGGGGSGGLLARRASLVDPMEALRYE